jgi:single-strand DNA-binding protein
MAGSVNRVILIGNLGADPEVKSFQSGGQIATMRIATSESWKDRQSGERKERTEWHSVVISGDGLVGVVERYLRKGSKVYVEGQLRTRKWQDRDGNDRYSTEIVVAGRGGALTMLDSANGGQGGDGRGERKRGYDDRGSRQAGHGNDDWGGGREVYHSEKGGWQDDQNSNRSSGDSWGGGFGDDLDDDIPF